MFFSINSCEITIYELRKKKSKNANVSLNILLKSKIFPINQIMQFCGKYFTPKILIKYFTFALLPLIGYFHEKLLGTPGVL